MPFLRLLRGVLVSGCPEAMALQKGKCWGHIRQKRNGTNRSWNGVGEHCPLVGRKVLEATWVVEMSSVTRGEGICSHAFKLVSINMNNNHIDPICNSQQTALTHPLHPNLSVYISSTV